MRRLKRSSPNFQNKSASSRSPNCANKRAGWLACRPIQPHVKRAVLLKTQASLEIGRLQGANTQVRQDAVHRLNFQLKQQLPALIEIGMEQSHRQTLQTGAGLLQHFFVLVQADQQARRSKAFGDQSAMAAAADRAVDDGLAWADGQHFKDLVRQNRHMARK